MSNTISRPMVFRGSTPKVRMRARFACVTRASGPSASSSSRMVSRTWGSSRRAAGTPATSAAARIVAIAQVRQNLGIPWRWMTATPEPRKVA